MIGPKCKALAGILAVAGLLFSASFGIGPKADIAPTSSAVEVRFQNGFAAGVYIGNGLVVTAKHVVDDAAKSDWIIVRDQAGEHVDAVPYWESKTTDVAMLKIKQPLPSVGTAQLDRRAPVIGEPIESVGTPLGHPFVHKSGTVASDPENVQLQGMPTPWNDAIEMRLPVQPGDSGGPVYDKDGKVLGIVVGAILNQMRMPVAFIMISAREVAA